MKITVLGSGSSFSASSRFNSCYLVEAGNEAFLIDCGSDALRAIQKSKVDLFSIKRIFITHMHADHCGGLPAVLTAMHVLDRKERVEVYVPFTQLEFVRVWLTNLFIFDERMSFGISLLPLLTGELVLEGNVRMEFFGTSHLDKYAEHLKPAGISPVSFSVAVHEGNGNFFFSSDISSAEEVEDHIRDSVSLIETTHPSLAEIASLAGRNGDRVYFTHIPQELENGGEWRERLRSEFGIKELNVVRDGQILTV